jgi:hypothetical protein
MLPPVFSSLVFNWVTFCDFFKIRKKHELGNEKRKKNGLPELGPPLVIF